MNKQFTKPLIEVIEILSDEIICTSPYTGGGEELDSDEDLD